MNPEQARKQIRKVLVKPLAITAGILGLLQGVVWTVSATLAICCYYGGIQVDNGEEYHQLIYRYFLNDSVPTSSEFIVSSGEFVIFMWFYLAFSAIWAIISGVTIWAAIHDQWHLAKSLFGAWSIITTLTTVVDIVLTGLIASDYSTLDNTHQNEDTLKLVTYGIVMSLVARGFVLLLINIIFTVIMTKFTIHIITKENRETNLPVIHGYETSNTNPPWFNDNIKDFWGSPQRTAEEPKPDRGYDNHGFERSQSFYPLQTETIQNDYATLPSAQYRAPQASPPQNITSFSEAIRTATIGRNKGRRSPPNAVKPPVIPDPDYTPPNSPNFLKSVLRSKSNYNRAPAF